MTDNAIVRLPGASRTNFFGVCPTCRRQNGWIAGAEGDWFFCDTHRVRWTLMGDVLGGWRDMTAEERFANADQLSGYREVEPFDIRKHGTDEERAAYAEMLQIAERLGLGLRVYAQPFTDPLDPVSEPAIPRPDDLPF